MNHKHINKRNMQEHSYIYIVCDFGNSHEYSTTIPGIMAAKRKEVKMAMRFVPIATVPV
jgi:hypothetical protein